MITLTGKPVVLQKFEISEIDLLSLLKRHVLSMRNLDEGDFVKNGYVIRPTDVGYHKAEIELMRIRVAVHADELAIEYAKMLDVIMTNYPKLRDEPMGRVMKRSI